MLLLDLPDAVFCSMLSKSLPVKDAISFASSCRRLHDLFQEDLLVWKVRCSQHEVSSIEDWQVDSFRVLYQKLLFPYTCLLGRWAGTVPIVGCMARIVLDPPCIR